MVYTEKNKDGFIYAYVEWWAVNREGRPDDKGEYAFINELWIHEAYRGNNGLIRRFIDKGARDYPQLKHMYYPRGKYANRLKCFSRGQLKKERIQWDSDKKQNQ